MSFVVALCVGCASICYGDVPELFRVWGKRGPEFAPVPEGWEEESLPTEEAYTPSAEERQLAFLLFVKNYAETVSPLYAPSADEIATELHTFATRGEYEPLTFFVYALNTIREVRVRVSPLARSGCSIPADHIDLRWVRPVRQVSNKARKLYRRIPFLLEKKEKVSVHKGENAQFWLTMKVPEQVRAGVYEATVKVSADGRTAQLPLRLLVLPFKLPKPWARMEMSFTPGRAKTDQVLRKNLIDLREHNITDFQNITGVSIVSRDRKFGEDDIQATVRGAERIMRIYNQVYGRYPSRFGFGIGFQIIYYWDHSRNWFNFWPYLTEEKNPEEVEDEAERLIYEQDRKMKEDFLKAGRLMLDMAKRKGWGESWAYIIDEPGGNPNMPHAIYWNTFIKKNIPEIKTHVCIGGGMALGIDEIGQLAPCIDHFYLNRFSREIYDSLIRNRKKEYGIYNGGSGVSVGGFQRDRFFYGFYAFRAEAREVLQWVYQFGQPWKEPFRGNHGYSYPTSDGPLPSVGFECIREGIDDYRYVQLLWSMITAGESSSDPQVGKAVKEARKELEWLMEETTFRFQAIYGREPAPPPAELQRRRWMVASRILDLSRFIKPETVKTVPTPPPTTWKEKRSREPEFDFGGSSDTVGVLVWASWKRPAGKPKLNLTLEAGRTYRFSAWVKSLNNQLPELVVKAGGGELKTKVLPPGSEEGWTRLATIIEVKKPARLSYICVRVVGARSTVWVDDISFAEVKKAKDEYTEVREFVTRGDFEGVGEQAWGPWVFETWKGKAGKPSIDSTVAHSGKQSIKLTNQPGGPKGDFEGVGERAWGPWSFESWKGRGTASLDTRHSHTGKQSVRLELVKNAGRDQPAVGVLLWASWRRPKGKPRLDMFLEAGERYMLSAWVRSQSGYLPSLRIATKGGKVKSKTQVSRRVGDWVELRHIVDVSAPARVSYVCVWVQGAPLTLWIDDIRFGRLAKPPAELVMKRQLFSGDDKRAELSLKMHSEPELIEVSFEKAGAGMLRTLSFSPQVKRVTFAKTEGVEVSALVRSDVFDLSFVPRLFPPGRYNIVIRLRGIKTPPFRCSFLRIRGPFETATTQP